MNNSNKTSKLGDILVHKKEITQEQLMEALSYQAKHGKKLGEILIEKGYVTEKTVLHTLSEQLGLEIVNLDNYNINIEAVKHISEKLAKRTNSIPVNIIKDKLIIAMSEPLNIFDIEDIEMESNMKVEIMLASKKQIEVAIEKYMGRQRAEKAVEDFTKENLEQDLQLINDEADINISNSPVVRLMNSLITQAIKMGASDIHIEPFETSIRVRFRIDGDLQEVLNPSKNSQSAIVTRIKIMAGMNIAERRLPQDGRIEIKIDEHDVDIRVSTIPTVHGEKVVMRLLERGNFAKTKKELGFNDQNIEVFDSLLKVQNGIILVAGPTGSGKTTTLYAALNELNKIQKNIITIEDPVEYKLEGVNQVQVNTKSGLLFSTGLRSILRQDPNIIMVGEIRDEETAEIAVRAAITGHLVISTIHTNDAPSTILRLQNMGIKTYMLISSIKGIISQRLVKKICTNCMEEYFADDEEKTMLKIDGEFKLKRGKGCAKCYQTGYSGRTAIHEILKMDKSIRETIQKGASVDEIALAAKKSGMKTLDENCRELVLSGITTVEEYTRAIYNID